jgi:hypothetical protein
MLRIRIGLSTDKDPDPALYLNSHPDPGSQIYAYSHPDPDQPVPSHSKLNLHFCFF